MSKRDYKVATTDGIELEPLGGEKCDKDKDKDKEKQTNGVTFDVRRIRRAAPRGETDGLTEGRRHKCSRVLLELSPIF
uniref:GG12449 n=1 Tax=Drosophila erecta TaxID=7220 RepID=B3P7E6_DROER